jgi:hypothetical protein
MSANLRPRSTADNGGGGWKGPSPDASTRTGEVAVPFGRRPLPLTFYSSHGRERKISFIREPSPSFLNANECGRTSPHRHDHLRRRLHRARRPRNAGAARVGRTGSLPAYPRSAGRGHARAAGQCAAMTPLGISFRSEFDTPGRARSTPKGRGAPAQATVPHRATVGRSSVRSRRAGGRVSVRWPRRRPWRRATGRWRSPPLRSRSGWRRRAGASARPVPSSRSGSGPMRATGRRRPM